MKQVTVKKSIVIKGIGLHTGADAKVVLNPMPENSGIMLSDGKNSYKLDAKMVSATNRGTVIKYGNNVLHTVEHMLSAIKALGIDNLEIVAEGKETPVLDGSSREYVLAIKKAGIVLQKAEKKFFLLQEPMLLSTAGKYMAALPGAGFSVWYFSDFSKYGVAPEAAGLKVLPGVFMKEIAGARTFGFKHEIEGLKKAGFIRGASLENAFVMDKGRPINGKLRYKNEIARHKVLDIIGDFSFIEGEINMTLIAYKTGHAENIKMVRRILNS